MNVVKLSPQQGVTFVVEKPRKIIEADVFSTKEKTDDLSTRILETDCFIIFDSARLLFLYSYIGIDGLSDMSII